MARLIRIGLTGGGTGGHTYPIVAVIGALAKMDLQGTNLQLHYFGVRNDFSKAILATGAIYHHVPMTKLRRYFSLQNLIDIPKTFIALFVALWKLWIVMPDVLFSKGGPGALPVVLAAWFYRIPVVIHESDSTPGITNLISSWFSKRIAITFESAAKFFPAEKTVLTGTPVRQTLLERKLDQGLAKERLGFVPEKALLLVTGGSQGAKALNDFILANLGTFLPLVQIYHQTGSGQYLEIQKLRAAAVHDIPVATEKESRYEFTAYLDEELLAEALSAADVVLARAGSGSIAEASAFGKPMILVPISSDVAGSHQRENAYAMQTLGAAFALEEENLATSIVAGLLQKIMGNKAVYAKMAAAAAAFYHADAPERIAEAIIGAI